MSGGRLPLLLLPGIEGQARVFERLLPFLDDRPCRAMDLPSAATVRALAEALWAGVDAPRVHLFGQSLGGLVAWEMAHLAPQRVGRLVTLGSLPHPRHRPRGLGLAATLLGAAPSTLRERAWRARWRARALAEGLDGELPPGRPDPRLLRAVADWRPSGLPPVPTLWLRGAQDDEAPWTGANLPADLPGVAFAEVPGGHRAALSHPAPLAAAIRGFLDPEEGAAEARAGQGSDPASATGSSRRS